MSSANPTHLSSPSPNSSLFVSTPCPSLLPEILPQQVRPPSPGPQVCNARHFPRRFPSRPPKGRPGASAPYRRRTPPNPPALLRQAILAATEIHSRALRPHPGLRERLLPEDRRSYRFSSPAKGCRDPPGTEESRPAGGLRVMHYTPVAGGVRDCCLSCGFYPCHPHFRSGELQLPASPWRTVPLPACAAPSPSYVALAQCCGLQEGLPQPPGHPVLNLWQALVSGICMSTDTHTPLAQFTLQPNSEMESRRKSLCPN